MNLIGILKNMAKPHSYLQVALDDTVGFIPRVMIQCVVYSIVQSLSFNNDNSEEETYIESAMCGILWVVLLINSLLWVKTPELNKVIG